MCVLCRIVKVPNISSSIPYPSNQRTWRLMSIYVYFDFQKWIPSLRHSVSVLIFLLVQAVKETICGEEEPEAASWTFLLSSCRPWSSKTIGFASVSSDVHLMGCLLTTVLKSFKAKFKKGQCTLTVYLLRMILVQRLEMSKACCVEGFLLMADLEERGRGYLCIFVYCLLPCQDEFTQIRLLPVVEYHAWGKVGW